MTDWQQPLIVALTQAEGVSIVHETVYENRFGFTDALVEMGADIDVHQECLGGRRAGSAQRNFEHSAVISGPTPLHGADIEVPDLRGGFSHLIAALAAEGTLDGLERRHHRARLRALHRRSSSCSGRTSSSKANRGVPPTTVVAGQLPKPRSETRRPSFFWVLAGSSCRS